MRMNEGHGFRESPRGTIALEISSRNSRVRALQDRWARLRAGVDELLTARGADLAVAPGGSTGLLIRPFQGKLERALYRVDPGLVALLTELRVHEKQAAEELRLWCEKR